MMSVDSAIAAMFFFVFLRALPSNNLYPSDLKALSPLGETTQWTPEVEQRMEQLPRAGERGRRMLASALGLLRDRAPPVGRSLRVEPRVPE